MNRKNNILNNNLLKYVYPDFYKDWDDENNIGRNKDLITTGSSKFLVAWKCHKCGFKWNQNVINRIKNNTQCRICANSDILLSNKFPEIFKEFHAEKNLTINPQLLTIGSSKKIWWKCTDCEHIWLQNIDTRVKLGAGCKKCKIKDNLFAKKYPELVKEWDYKKNKDLNPLDFTCGSNEYVWWLCKNGHSYNSQIYQRTNGSGCKKCLSYKKNRKSFLVEYPHLETEWHYKKNKGLNPINFSSGSNKIVWWICSNSHSYECDIWRKANKNSGCPYCRGLKIDTSNSLLSLRPDICKEWDYNKNKNINPGKIPVGSNKFVWWICSNKHSWQSYVYNRTKKNGTTCPMCSGRTSSDTSSLFYLFPDLIDEWDYDKNTGINPKLIRPGSHKKVSWVCKLNSKHKWETSIYSRTSKEKVGCPFCSGKLTLKEESVASINPPFMKEWDWDKNKNYNPFTLSPKSDFKVWWKCTFYDNHIWRTSIAHRNNGTNCPYCSGTSLLIRRYTRSNKLKLTDKIQLYYLVFYNTNECFYKIGITKNTISKRYSGLFNKTGYKILEIKIISGQLKDIINLEQTTHKKVTRKLDTELIRYKPKIYFDGRGECYNLPSVLEQHRDLLTKNYKRHKNFITIKEIEEI